MADNYIEKRMEDMRAGKFSTSKSTHYQTQSPLSGLRVLVTGGASGIGRSVVEHLRKLNCKVAFCDIDTVAGRRIENVYGAKFFECDVSDESQLSNIMDTLFAESGDLDVIVNNVGISNFKKFPESTLKDFDRVIRTNLYPIFITSRLWALHREHTIKGNGASLGEVYGGRIINISSSRAFQSQEGSEGYTASKGAIIALTHALMMSMRKYSITVNSISPGWINTDLKESFSDSDRLQHPSGRIGEPADIARLVEFLINPKNNFINGENIVVDGGMSRQMIYHAEHGWTYLPGF